MSETNYPRNCCAEGFKHTGTPAGKLIDIDGVETYVTGDESLASTKTIFFLSDVLGHKFENGQLLADEYAKAGYFVVSPDVFKKDPAPLNPHKGFDLFKDWLPKHGPADMDERVKSIFKAVKAKYQPKVIYGIGFCYTAKFILHLLAVPEFQAAAIYHPSAVTAEEFKAIKAPLYVGTSETDEIFPAPLRRHAEDGLLEAKVPYRVTLNYGTDHGFAIRGDLSNPWVTFAREQAFSDTLNWFKISNALAQKK